MPTDLPGRRRHAALGLPGRCRHAALGLPGRRRPAALAQVGRTAVLAMAVVLLAGAAGCADEPVAPLPVRPPGTTISASPATPSPPSSTVPPPTVVTTAPAPPPPTRRAPTSQRSTHSPSPSATTSEVCLGAVRYELPLSDPGPLPSSLCFATGGVLRLQGIGPGEVTVDREDLVESQYAAGVVDLRFVRAGTVEVSVPRTASTEVITVVVR
ncbi:hypothetical protein [Micromonospora lutea]|uniref:Uncharacterized protein n=1 Tax=Micromonospora lutea TaxID=419825 RepID=A0ABQ4IXK8_9ACTN|nr:hypothetical protein [Micromonospora lutea]GIJ22664.1 hypothetical protein Vlu01_32880 [Micromonospora lutea]